MLSTSGLRLMAARDGSGKAGGAGGARLNLAVGSPALAETLSVGGPGGGFRSTISERSKRSLNAFGPRARPITNSQLGM